MLPVRAGTCPGKQHHLDVWLLARGWVFLRALDEIVQNKVPKPGGASASRGDFQDSGFSSQASCGRLPEDGAQESIFDFLDCWKPMGLSDLAPQGSHRHTCTRSLSEALLSASQFLLVFWMEIKHVQCKFYPSPFKK